MVASHRLSSRIKALRNHMSIDIHEAESELELGQGYTFSCKTTPPCNLPEQCQVFKYVNL